MFVLYRLLLTIGFPLLIVYVLLRGFKDRRYFRNLAERFGFIDFRPTIPGGIWLHAVSVGEVMAAVELIAALRQAHPRRAVFVSCSTIAGRALADERLAQAALVFYAPFDLVWIVRRVLRRLRPSMLIVLETEIWPVLWREAKHFGAAVYVVNGRISDRSWPRYRRLSRLFQPTLEYADAILAQSETDAERFREMGAPRVKVIGNIKYDARPAPAPPPEVVAWAGRPPLFIAASTMPPDEDDAVIAAFQKLPPGTRMILAPRKPELFAQTAAKLQAAGVDFVRRTQLDRDAAVLLLDTVGELASCFALNAVVFVGGSLVDWGGHNILEPALFGRPILVGPHMQNFAAMFRLFDQAGALGVVHDAAELAAAVTALLAHPGVTGVRARELAESQRGATARALAIMAPGAPLTHRPFRWFYWPASRLWLAGMAIHRSLSKPVRLAKPVISVGGIAMGGVGKTPVVRWLAAEMTRRGIRIGILTRGYGRTNRRQLILHRGALADINDTGDEAQLYLLDGHAFVGIGSDRVATGHALESQVDVFLLDDGFQHWRLARDFDLVLVDADDPHAGGGVFPLGLLREPPAALERADAVVSVTKVVVEAPPPGKYTAVCGIGNPASFRESLAEAGIEIAGWHVFPDHHRFSSEELAALTPPLITTEKDAARFPPGAPTPHVLRVAARFPDQEEILNRIIGLVKTGSD